MALESNPLRGGVPAWVTTSIENTGDDDVIFSHDSCATIVHVDGELVGQSWRAGLGGDPADPASLLSYANEEWTGRPGPIRISFVPKRQLPMTKPDSLPQESACADIGTSTTLPPGERIRERALWSGSADDRLGPPPSGPVTIVGRIESYRRASSTDGWLSLDLPIDAQIVEGRSETMLHPMEVVDAAYADEAFRAFIDSLDPQDTSWVIWYDPKRDVWEIGAFDYDRRRLEVARVDPETGVVRSIIERKRR
jgi:hypothetical protein